MAPLSLGEATLKPELIRFWVTIRSSLVLFKYCSATMAPMLVLTLRDIRVALRSGFTLERFAREAFCPKGPMAIRVPLPNAGLVNQTCGWAGRKVRTRQKPS